MSLSIVIPTLNAAGTLPAALANLGGPGAGSPVGEIIVADGGSDDDTVVLAEAHGARVVVAPPGRGPQLAAGAAAAVGDWLLFLHADTILDRDWTCCVGRFMTRTDRDRAGYFRFVLDDGAPAARALERVVALRCRLLALPYGDQGLVIRRSFYDALGGYRPLPLMEDVDLVRRIGRRRLVPLPAPAVTSAARYRHDGYAARTLRNAACLSLWHLGVPPARLARLYG